MFNKLKSVFDKDKPAEGTTAAKAQDVKDAAAAAGVATGGAAGAKPAAPVSADRQRRS